MKIALVLFMILHGTVHSMGFVKAFRIAEVSQLAHPITKSNGILWLLTGLLFVFAAILFSTDNGLWWIFSTVAVVLSQYLVVNDWHDAKLGTIANIIVLLASIIGFVVWCIAKY